MLAKTPERIGTDRMKRINPCMNCEYSERVLQLIIAQCIFFRIKCIKENINTIAQ